MTDQTNPPPSTYIIDTSGTAEIARLIEQDRFVTRAMGELFPRAFSEQVLEEEPIRVLDIACGPGSWVLEVAYASPEMLVTGIDNDPSMVAFARARASSQQRYNATFHAMDATTPLAFPDGTFDFVNGRFLNSFLTRATWPTLVREAVRVTKGGGWLRFTECDDLGRCTSEAILHFEQLFLMAWRADPLRRLWPITPRLGQFLHEAGCQHIHEQPHLINFSAPWDDDPEQAARHAAVCDNLRVGPTLLQPYLQQRQMITPALSERLLDQLARDLQDPDLRGLWTLVSVIGRKPQRQDTPTQAQRVRTHEPESHPSPSMGPLVPREPQPATPHALLRVS